MYLKDITNDFIKHSTPGKGHIYIEEGIDRISHKQEIETAHWLLDNFGGEITILKERNTFNIKYADYRWNGKLWELKKVSNKLSLDNGLRKAIAQIANNPGGIIINDISLIGNDYASIIINRLKNTRIKHVLLIFRKKSKIEIIYEYKKRK